MRRGADCRPVSVEMSVRVKRERSSRDLSPRNPLLSRIKQEPGKENWIKQEPGGRGLVRVKREPDDDEPRIKREPEEEDEDEEPTGGWMEQSDSFIKTVLLWSCQCYKMWWWCKMCR